MSAIATETRAAPAIRDLVALTKPRVTALVIATTAGGLWLAPGTVTLVKALATLLATSAVVGAANALNCWLERDVDRHMSRTRNRPLPAGRLLPAHALWLGIVLAVISVPVLTLVASPMAGLLATVALVSYVGLYTPLKQRTPKALLVGAVPGALPPLIGWAAATGGIEAPGLALFGILFVWQIPHFLAIAMFRKEEYARAGIAVLPAVRGERVTKIHAALWAIVLVPVTLAPAMLGLAGTAYIVVASVLGAAFVGIALAGLRPSAGRKWARTLFFASLVYLPLIFISLVVDAG